MKLTGPLERVLRAFLADPSAPRYGYDLMKASGLHSGTLYPMLSRLQEQGLVTSAWEAAEAGGRPPRRYYRLTGEGIETARQELARGRAGRPGAARHAARPVARGGTQPARDGAARFPRSANRMGDYLVSSGVQQGSTHRAADGVGERLV